MKSAGVPRSAASRAASASSIPRTSNRSYSVRGCEPSRCIIGVISRCGVRLATNEPLPCVVSMIPRACSSFMPSRTAVRDTPSFSVSRRSDGSACPAFSTPSTISFSIRSATTSATRRAGSFRSCISILV